VPAEVTHIGAHISASTIAAVGLRSMLPVQTISTFFIAIVSYSPLQKGEGLGER
jgi:hypothetical protein